ncbi:hypothetical protein GV819_12005 [Pseudomonas sp. Fl5BN2]|uniref:hypothetical protein n=1 Tax=unclassified Pseudomonas TaxID=196821 RepID=UPI0013766906|nr:MULTISPECIES: hypothetical protein [unclassified Pseudomonas]NBF03013.1 hypothetical protein [Pseudomonas sp. Fl5BN2]NBF12421.1 hypothetical protein [Pseudomonas sp. Fl4BN1]
MNGSRLMVAAFLAFLTNGATLLGVGQGSAGALARNIECKHLIAHHSQAAKPPNLLAGTPPVKARGAFPGPFALECPQSQRCPAMTA